MESNRIRRVVIAGGGTAGWIAASALAHQFRDLLEITLVESTQIGTVGVGESTVPPVRNFHRFLNIDEREFMREVAGSFKLAISFENWGRDGERYIHPFGIAGAGTLVCAFHHFWLESRRRGLEPSFGDYCLEAVAAQQDRFALLPETQINYAYHLDAGMYTAFLRRKFEGYGVRHVEGRIRDVRQHADNGYVRALVLEDGQEIEGDLFIDCTGMRGLLIEQTLQTGYEDWGHWLPCDRALALQTETVDPSPVPYTRAIAHGAGWRWQIPLQHRLGCGLVFSSRHLSEDEARARLLQDVDGKPVREPRLVAFRTGCRRKVWNKNVVALGLASGFVEPLESTTIHLTMSAVMRLIELFPGEGIAADLVDIYNDACRRELENVRDFIILHYHANQRDEPMWKACQTMALPDSLHQRIAAWRERAHVWHGAGELFTGDSWVHVMMGQGIMPGPHHPLSRALSDADLRRVLAGIRRPIQQTVAKMAPQQAFIDRYCKASPATWTPQPVTA